MTAGAFMAVSGGSGSAAVAWYFSNSGGIQALIIFVAVGLVVLGSFVWAAFFRKRGRRHRRSRRHVAPPPSAPAPNSPNGELAARRPQRRRRRVRREKFPRNPTLAETGGLPPARPDSPEPPPPSI